MKGELTETQVRNILSSQVVGRMACTDNKHPYIVPVTYTYDGNYIYGQTNEGEKLKILRANPNVCFEVDAMTDMKNWQSVVIDGEFEELEDTNAEDARAILLNKVFCLSTICTVHDSARTITAEELDDSTRLKEVMYRIKINRVSGRFEKQ